MSKKGYIQSSEHRAKIAAAHVGMKHSLSSRLKMSASKKALGMVPPSRMGLSHTPEWKISASNRMIGNKFNIGRKHSMKWRSRMSVSNRGDRGTNWKGGLTKLGAAIRNGFTYKIWRESVFTRDNWTCQKCGVRGGKINAHHIKRFSEILKYNKIKSVLEAEACSNLWEISNGTTLCKRCHRQTHKEAN